MDPNKPRNPNNNGLSEFKNLVANLKPVIQSIAEEMISNHVAGQSRLREDNVQYSRHVAGQHVRERVPLEPAAARVAAPAGNAPASMSSSEVADAREGVMAARSVRAKYAKAARDEVLRKRGKGETADYDDELKRVYARDPLGIEISHSELVDLADSREACEVMLQTPAEHDSDLMERATYSRRAADVVLKSREAGKPVTFEAALRNEMRKTRYAKSTVSGYWKGTARDVPPAIDWNAMDAEGQRRARIAREAREEVLSRRGLGEVVTYDEVFERMLGGNAGPGEDMAGATITTTRGVAAAAAADTLGRGLGSGDVKPTLGPLRR